MSENWKFQASPKIGDTLFNIRGETVGEFLDNLRNFPFGDVAQFVANLNGASAVGGISQPAQQPAQSAPPTWAASPQPSQPPAASGAVRLHPEGKTCAACGSSVVYKEAKGGQYKFWTCPNQKSKGDGHHSEWID